ncbi:MAG: hypothetical protein DWQ42_19520 [Planctomycetota bacterium]|nr:MAG: hypothetical protein DWQ42_19520 [Planctomycetota bacterium]REK37505.1 MAG: hypothetical protein DWQ46_22000 [Planctomycetota bacterium]
MHGRTQLFVLLTTGSLALIGLAAAMADDEQSAEAPATDAQDSEATAADAAERQSVDLPEPHDTATVWPRALTTIEDVVALLDAKIDTGEIKTAEIDTGEINTAETSERVSDEEEGEDANAGLTLEGLVNLLAEQTTAPLRLDLGALEELGIEPEVPVELEALPQGVSARSFLEIVLKTLDPELTWMVRHEVLWVTTREVAEDLDNQVIKVYDVVDLAAFCVREDGTVDTDVDTLIDLITHTIQPDSWEDTGGSGRVSELELSGTRALVVGNTWQTHERIAGLLAGLRAMRHKKSGIPGCGHACGYAPYFSGSASYDGAAA